MELEFRGTQKFEDELARLSPTEQHRIVNSVNERGQLALSNREAFYKGLVRPGGRKVAGQWDSSLYILSVDDDLRVIFALDDDPVFERVIVTLMRVVGQEESAKAFEEAYRETASMLYREGILNGAEEKDRGTGKTAARRVRRHS